MSDLLVKNIGELLTLDSLASQADTVDIRREHLGLYQEAWLFCSNGKVCDFGTGEGWKQYSSSETRVVEAQGQLVLPGLVDSHTHLLYGGDRTGEFAKRLNGMTYSEIAEAGGGIYSSVRDTEKTSDEELLRLALERARGLLSYGVTTLEVKSGYSLTIKEELRQLRLLQELRKRALQFLRITSLPLHAVPKDKSSQDYIKECSELLKLIKKEDLADFVDMFIEKGYYEADECEPFIEEVKSLGFGLKIHADEFTRSGGSVLAAKWGAVSADHLQFASKEDKQSLGKKGVMATLLPGTSLYTKIPFTDGKSFIEEGCQVAVASDHNPGSCQLSNLPMLTSLAALHCGLTAPQALASVTFMGAKALELSHKKGALAKGYDADLQILPFRTHEQWLAAFGEKKPREVFINGIAEPVPGSNM